MCLQEIFCLMQNGMVVALKAYFTFSCHYGLTLHAFCFRKSSRNNLWHEYFRKSRLGGPPKFYIHKWAACLITFYKKKDSKFLLRTDMIHTCILIDEKTKTLTYGEYFILSSDSQKLINVAQSCKKRHQ